MPNDTPAATPRSDPPPVPPQNASETHSEPAPIANATAQDVVATDRPRRTAAQFLLHRRRQFAANRLKLLKELLIQLDHLIFAQMAYMYYLDPSFLRLLLRLYPQITLLTPSSLFPALPSTIKPYFSLLLGTNLIIIFLHLLLRLPSASDPSHRGYLHGGLLADFIGQTPPSSKIWLVGLDAWITALQFFMLAVHIEAEGVKEVLKSEKTEVWEVYERGSWTTGSYRPPTSPPAVQADEGRPSIDLEAGDADIEMQPLNPSTTGPSAHSNNEEETSSGPSAHPQPDTEALDEDALEREEEQLLTDLGIFDSGNVTLGEFHVLDTARSLRKQSQHKNTEASLFMLGSTAGYQLRSTQGRLRRAGVL